MNFHDISKDAKEIVNAYLNKGENLLSSTIKKYSSSLDLVDKHNKISSKSKTGRLKKAKEEHRFITNHHSLLKSRAELLKCVADELSIKEINNLSFIEEYEVIKDSIKAQETFLLQLADRISLLEVEAKRKAKVA